ncbi:MAG: hypothetical protein BGO44_03380 [Legionella sp. 39-23]|nr:MAG: hypothetical protein BGO44_03380 [Legionella sp. 39-23]
MEFIRIQKRGHRVVFILFWFISNLSFSSPLKIGLGVSGPPIVEKVTTAQGSHYFGFCIDLMDNICKRIKNTCSYSEVTLNDQFDLLDSGKVDLLILASPYTPYHLKQYAFSIPYATSKFQFITLKNSSINKIADIKNKKIGVNKNTFYGLLLKSPYGKHNQIIPYDSTPDLFSDLAENKIDVIVLNHAIAHNITSNNIFNVKAIGHDLPLGNGYGIIGLADKAPLIEEINKAILQMEHDGTYTAIYQKYYEH